MNEMLGSICSGGFFRICWRCWAVFVLETYVVFVGDVRTVFVVEVCGICRRGWAVIVVEASVVFVGDVGQYS